MANNEAIKRGIANLQRIKTWQLVLILLLLLFISATFLRLNNIGMVQRRDAVLSADEQVNTDVIQARLYDLQRYSASHMNAGTGAIYLENLYNYDKQQLVTRAQQSQNQDIQNLQARVDTEICRPLAVANGWRWTGGTDDRYTQCLVNELAKYPAASGYINEISLDPNLYRHTFISPTWSPDFAGFSVLLSFILAVVITARFIGVIILRLLVRRHYKRA